MFLTIPVYFINPYVSYWKYIAINLFIFNIILLYSMTFIDKPLTDFYHLFSIPSFIPLLSKVILLGGISLIHLVLLMTFTLKMDIKSSIMVLSFLITLIVSGIIKPPYWTIVVLGILNSLIIVTYYLSLKPAQLVLFFILMYSIVMMTYFRIKKEQYDKSY